MNDDYGIKEIGNKFFSWKRHERPQVVGEERNNIRNIYPVSANVFLILAAALMPAIFIPTQPAEAVADITDFNDDGFADLAIGVTFEDLGSVSNAGAVNVIYGSASGLSATSTLDQLWHQNSAGIEDASERDDTFGSSLAAGDFNKDGFADLAIGVPNESVGSTIQAGAVNVIYGSASGLSATSTPDQLWHQNTPSVEDSTEPSDGLGFSLASS